MLTPCENTDAPTLVEIGAGMAGLRRDRLGTLQGDHPDWDDYRRAMTEAQHCIVRFEILSAEPDVQG